MRRGLALTLLVLVVGLLAYAKTKEEVRLENCARIMKEIVDIPNGVPQDLLDKAECVVVIPVRKGGFIVGARVGKGAAVCRRGARMAGPWSPPAMYELGGSGVGLQMGGGGTDYILLVMTPEAARKLISGQFILGKDATVVVGPQGGAAATDAQKNAEFLIYSRSKGLVAGTKVLEGSPLSLDSEANQKIYGKKIEAKALLLEAAEPVPAAGKPLVELLTQRSPKKSAR